MIGSRIFRKKRDMSPEKPDRAEAAPLQVLAAVLEKNGRWLIAKRRRGDRFAGYWEFPGGKPEPGETPEECLSRELLEELGIRVRVGRCLGSVRCRPPGLDIELTAYRVSLRAGTPRLRDHEEIRWVTPGEVGDFALTEPDRLLLENMLAGKTRESR
jgi:8-oxo-dGTP diphosphatase